jgi:hypothetical protein
MTLTSPGTVGTPCRILCVNHSGTVPPVSADLRATATVTTTGNSAITVNGSFYCYGIIFSCGNGANSPQLSLGANASAQVYEACAIRSGATSNPFINVTGASVNNQVTFINTTVQFAAAAAFLSCGQGFFTWKNTASAITGATLPTTLFKVNVNRSCIALIEGVDLSALGSGKTRDQLSHRTLSLRWERRRQRPPSSAPAARRTARQADRQEDRHHGQQQMGVAV